MVHVSLWVSAVGPRSTLTELGIVQLVSLFAAQAFLHAGSRGLHVWVKGTYQPVEWRVVHQVVHGGVQRLSEAVQLRSAGGQHPVGEVPERHRLAEAAADLGGQVGDGERLILDVLGEALQTRHQPLAGGLQLVGEPAGQGQRTGLNTLHRKRHMAQ